MNFLLKTERYTHKVLIFQLKIVQTILLKRTQEVSKQISKNIDYDIIMKVQT
jgi:hypothetical protein